jgi:hypothetical protein
MTLTSRAIPTWQEELGSGGSGVQRVALLLVAHAVELWVAEALRIDAEAAEARVICAGCPPTPHSTVQQREVLEW